MGHMEEARKSLAWALQIDPRQIALPTAIPDEVRAVPWLQLFRYPRSVAASCLTAISQTGGVGLLLWITALLVLVLQITPAEASYLMIYVSLVGIAGRLFCSYLSDAIGRRASGMLIGYAGAITMALAGYLNSVWLGGVSMFFVLLMCQRFFGDGSYAIIGPYIAEVWPARLRASGMGLGYGVGNLGKIIGPLGLALIIGSSNYVSPKATLDAIVPAFQFLAFWYALAATAFWLVGFETKGRSIEEIDASLTGAAAAIAPAAQPDAAAIYRRL